VLQAAKPRDNRGRPRETLDRFASLAMASASFKDRYALAASTAMA
jgi:hypothetical protein